MKMKKYGLPYQGSKSKIAEKLGAMLPNADVFIDLFAGGCAMTDWALQSGKYKQVIANDIREPSPVRLFKDALDGKYNPELFTPQWVSREQFHAEKAHNAYIAYIWSFGNRGDTYIFGKNIEDIKRAAHNFIVHKDYADLSEYINFTDNQVLDICALPSIRERRLAFRKIAGSRKLKDIQQLEQLQQLERLERLQQLDILQLDYRSVVIPDNAVVYCDIPYTGTSKYGKQSFNHDDFWKWVREQTVPVFVSEYVAPDDFECILEIEHISTLSSTNNSKRVVEKLFWNGV